MQAVSVTIITLNEEDRIAGAINSAAWADEVLVLDSGSADGTVEVARTAGATVFVEGWPGFGAQKNRAAQLARNSWALSLDADERIGPGLARSILALEERPGPAAYRMRRRNYMEGRVIRHWPWAWDRTARLYDRSRAAFSEPRVHESLVVNGAVAELDGVLEHLTYRDWDDYRRRRSSYARLGAEQAYLRGRRPRVGDAWLRPTVSLLRHLLTRGYLLGGALGFRLSFAAAVGTWIKYRELRRLDNQSET